ncbi:NAD(P)H-binding protein [Actinobaculum sp. 352]|uniref:NAD(P)H-binding protein n=1 Tax=Actinobaculum sp. 352 TaxID=2490946 RepID=UPI000F7F32F2|nr:NAD(P)H-binding protein [Actinobaculum sp. 352]RTE49841.1 NAD-dependent epimerase/dehydratase family protein [Actinobaculum sp. 352]
MSRIIIIGGHGKVALLLAPLLAARGDDVVSLIRDESQSGDVTAAGAAPVVLSVEDADEDELAAAFTGADAIVWSAGAAGKGGPTRTNAVDREAAIRSINAALAAGVSRYVMVSWAGSHGDNPVAPDHPLRAYAMAKLDADRHLAASGLDWTIVGPGLLTLDEPTGQIDVGRVEGESSAPTSRANVAAVIAAVLAEPSSIGRVIPFRDGATPIANAVANVPIKLADLDH